MCADQTFRMWRLTPVDDLSLSSYDNDNPDGPALLGVSPTVDALAALICAEAIAAPRSVSSGDWGPRSRSSCANCQPTSRLRGRHCRATARLVNSDPHPWARVYER